MPLRFPNERLHIYELVNNGLSGRQALVETACNNGLIRADDKAALCSTIGSPCDCSTAARQILQHYFRQRICPGSAETVDLAEEAWSGVEREFESYENLRSKKCIGPESSPACTGARADSGIDRAACRHHCSILFDLVLQQIRRYP
ncbi:MAG: hypothetical protein K2W95_34845 [Candidatus Obscuribacterales bacterium]|nr:hypothetical protein [Candidatus Obscuribacterales bacterium]